MVRTSNPYDVSPQGTLVGNLVPLWNVYFGLALQVGNVDVSIVKLLYATSWLKLLLSSLRVCSPWLWAHISRTSTSIIEQSDHLLWFLAINLEMLKEPQISRKRAEFIALTRGYIQVNFIVSVCQMKNAWIWNPTWNLSEKRIMFERKSFMWQESDKRRKFRQLLHMKTTKHSPQLVTPKDCYMCTHIIWSDENGENASGNITSSTAHVDPSGTVSWQVLSK